MIGRLLIATVGAILAIALLFTAAATGTGSVADSGLGGGAAGCSTTGTPTEPVSGYGPDQIANAATIVAVGNRMQVPAPGLVIAIATAIQESRLRNLDHGDRDSLGLFQQRPSQGWGTPTQIMNPTYAATTFYRRLLEIPRWQHMSLNDAAQTVQRSATPHAYGRHEPTARAITAAVSRANCTPPIVPGPTAARAIAFAHDQIGLPYVWGGNGAELTELPNGQKQVTGGFDCSGWVRNTNGVSGVG